MRVVQTSNTETINIGRQLENLATEVVFDLSNWIAEFGDGTAALIVRRVGDSNIYPVSIERQDSKAIWKVTSADTELAQKGRYGRCELRWYVGDVLAKSNIWKLYVEPSMTGQSGTTPPTPEQSWVDKVLEAGNTAENAAANAKDSAFEAKASEDNAAKSATDAKDAMTAAQVAQRVAEDAKSVAVQSAQEAAGSASAASTSETNAKASEVSAKASETAAQESKTAAAESASVAANSAASASASASAASESATEAAASETAAKASEEAAKASETAAKASETAAAESASSAQQSATSAAESAAVYDDIVADVDKLKEDVAAITPDDTAVDGKPWTSKKIVDSLCQPFEESGNPVQCYPVENYPLGVKVSWEPTQEGSGDPSPDNIRPITGRNAVSMTRCGKNLFDIGSQYKDQWYSSHSSVSNNATIDGNSFNFKCATSGISWVIRLKKIKVAQQMQYKFDYTVDNATGEIIARVIIRCFDRYGQIIRDSSALSGSTYNDYYEANVIAKNNESLVFSSDVEFAYFGFTVYSDSPEDIGKSAHVNNILLECGSTETDYEPYTGSTTDIALPETVYGGTLDVETGVLTVEWIEKVTQLGDTSLLDPVGDGFVRKTLSTFENAIHGESNQKCNIAPYLYSFWDASTHFYVGTNGYGMIILPVDTPAETVIQTVCKVSVPYTIQLSPQQIAALSGTNTIYTDADGVVVTGAEDPKHTITELKNAIISLGGNI